MFSNFFLIVLIFIFFSWLFCKSYYSSQFHPSIKTFFIFYVNFDSNSFDFFCPLTRFFLLFNFTIQSNIKFILFFNFDLYSFNGYIFFNSFVWLKFQFYPSIFDWLRIELHGFFKLGAPDLMTRVMDLKS